MKTGVDNVRLMCQDAFGVFHIILATNPGAEEGRRKRVPNYTSPSTVSFFAKKSMDDSTIGESCLLSQRGRMYRVVPIMRNFTESAHQYIIKARIHKDEGMVAPGLYRCFRKRIRNLLIRTPSVEP